MHTKEACTYFTGYHLILAYIVISRYIDIMKKQKLSYLSEAAECLKVLAHPKRLMILTILRDEPNLSVGEIAERCCIQSHVASEHLRLMLRCGFLSFTKDGRTTFYTVAEPQVYGIIDCIERKFKVNK